MDSMRASRRAYVVRCFGRGLVGLGGVVLAGALVVGGGMVVSAVAEPKPNPQKLKVRDLKIESRRITHFDRTNPLRTQFGQLEFIGGLRLSSSDKTFGGWSGIAVDEDGRGFVAVSDAGLWMTGKFDYRDGRLSGVQGLSGGPLKALNGSNLRRERDRDAEAIEFVSGASTRGRVLIAFEQNHRIGRFNVGPQGLSAPKSYVRPNKSRGRMSSLKGFEAMTVLTRGRYRGSILAISERKRDSKGRHTGWIFSGGKGRSFSLTDIAGYDITGAAILPGGDVVVLERRFNWLEGVKMRLRRLPLEKVRPGANLEGQVLLEATMAQDIDNMEGIAVHRDAKGNAIITVMSDDNFNRLFQRTIVLQFRLGKKNARLAKP